ncbi:hypothetical protein KM043_016551 [Ampulex compressa]|nr:hypothetical protein KM043_016551 [Ampulex compressa]
MEPMEPMRVLPVYSHRPIVLNRFDLSHPLALRHGYRGCPLLLTERPALLRCNPPPRGGDGGFGQDRGGNFSAAETEVTAKENSHLTPPRYCIQVSILEQKGQLAERTNLRAAKLVEGES